MAIKSQDKKRDINEKSKEMSDSSNQLESLKEIIMTKKNEEEDMFILSEPKYEQQLNSSDDEKEEQWLKRSSTREAVYGSAMMGDFKQMMAIDVDSEDFKSLPTDIQHELLSDIKEIRKRRRTQFEKMPECSHSFSNYQLKGLLAKRNITEKIEQVEKRMQEDNAATMTTLGYDENLFEAESIKANQLISDENTRYILISKLAKKHKSENENASIMLIEPKLENNLVKLKSTNEDVIKLQDEDDFVNNNKPDYIEMKDKPGLIFKKQQKITDTLALELPSKKVIVVESKSSVSLPEQERQSDRLPDDDGSKTSTSAHIVKDLSGDEFKADEMSLAANHVETIIASANSSSEDESTHEIDSTRASLEDMKYIERKAPSDRSVAVSSPNYSDVISADVRPKSSTTNHSFAADSSVNSIKIDSQESDEEFEEVEEVPVDVTPTQAGLDATEMETEIDTTGSDVSAEANPWLEFGDEDVTTIQEQMDAEDVDLLERMKSSDRAARDLSDVATSESQQLLQMFGIPFLVSPQEAESQCAYLDASGLTMGTITDDSDVLLFGGRVVYKSVFDKKRDPSMYTMNSIKAELGLDRTHLINIALCSGSDYTVGIENVGPVAALEIMKEFPGAGVESLLSFATWWKKAHEQVHVPPSETKIKRRLRKFDLPPDFPSQLVVDAYINPVIDESKESFSWGIPDLDAIRNFLIERLNWSKGRVDEVLLPVLKKSSERSNKQKLLTDYFNDPVASLQASRKKKSKRVSRAIFGIVKSEGTAAEAGMKPAKKKGKRKKAAPKTKPPVAKRPVTDTLLCLSESSSSDSS